METTPHGSIDTSKLPQYAQQAIESLRRQVMSLRKRVAELESGDDTTGTRARSGTSLVWYPLPANQQYEFDLDGESGVEVGVRQEHDGLWLAINAVHGRLEVAPRASNLIHVRESQR